MHGRSCRIVQWYVVVDRVYTYTNSSFCIDYIGNTVIQKLFEHCSEQTKLRMLEKIAPFLASIGVHKNGTWAAQKIIDYANTPEEIRLVRQHIAPYVPLLLLDQFGNYVVQCCLRKGAEQNQYIFDAIVDKCWEIGQGRFGARAVRAILENPIVTKEQQVRAFIHPLDGNDLHTHCP